MEIGGDSIAFPVIGAGKLHFPPNDACRIMLDETLKFCQNIPRHSSLKDIRFVAFNNNQGTIDALRNAMDSVQGTRRTNKVQLGEYKRRLSVEVINGNLIYENTDAIVNIMGSGMDMNNAGQLGRDLAKASGQQVQLECNLLGRQTAGSAVMTSGGNLAARHIIHLIPGSGSKDSFIKCLENCLRLAESRGLQSISLPAVGTGRYNMAAADSASVIFQVLNRLGSSFNNVRQVRIVVRQTRMTQAFLREKAKYSTPSLTPTLASFAKKSSQVGIEIVRGDLTSENTDAIVNTINTDMEMRNAGQLSKLIANASGPQVEDECRRLGLQQGGTAVLTRGGNLLARNIIHLVLISSDRQHLHKCLEDGLRLAESRGLRTISVPAIGTGGHGLSAVHSAKMIFQAVQNVGKDCVNVRKVRIAVFQDQMLEVFQQEQMRQQNNCRDRAATQQVKQTLRVSVIGKDGGSVSKAVKALQSGFGDEFLSSKVKNEGISYLTESQVDLLLEQARIRDIEMAYDAPRNRIDVRGDIVEMPKMVEMIYEEISKRKKQLEEEQERENALMVSKTIEWAYELNGQKAKFDLIPNYKIEMADSNGIPFIKVSLHGDEFDIDLKAKSGYGQLGSGKLTVIRKLTEGNKLVCFCIYKVDFKCKTLFFECLHACIYTRNPDTLFRNPCQKSLRLLIICQIDIHVLLQYIVLEGKEKPSLLRASRVAKPQEVGLLAG